MAEISCPRCQSLFLEANVRHVPDGLVCPSCKAVVPARQRAGEEKHWFLTRNKKKAGPFTLAQLRTLIVEGKILATDMAWHRGMASWMRVDSIPCLVHESPIADSTFGDTLESQVIKNDRPESTGACDDCEEEDIFLAGGLYVGPGRAVSGSGKIAHKDTTLKLADFLITKKLGSGGMGTVYQARRKSTGQMAALKILTASLADHPMYVSRFWQEALILEDLHHANLVQFLGAGQGDDLYFIAMEFIEGVSCARILKKLDRLSVPDALFIALQCARGLDYACNRQVVHRDVKPDNLLLTRTGQVKITDFGLAKSLDQNFDLTESGLTLGTPRYMPPEQYLDAKKADFRSDVYALGGVLFHCLTGRCPFLGNSAMELMLNKEKGHIPSARRQNPDVPPRLDLILGKMLAREPKYRYQKYQDLIADLTALDLAAKQLSFDPIRLLGAAVAEAQPEVDSLEILFVQVDIDNLLQAQQALEKKQLANSFHIVKDGGEGIAFLQRTDEFADSPRPHLIVLGGPVRGEATFRFLQEIKDNETWHSIPLVVLGQTPDTLAFLHEHGFQAHLVVHHLQNSEKFDDVIGSVQGLCVTVFDRDK